ncbi:hypothetical protein DPMN_002901 [Dreissena polymorpha]|uniref:Uncharacterized protein n=1 Tax=Dreissena polymorpha TaxID=45954 RepID=A0A9D4RU97_DREPO|nr:hypothetical protein DPMN_002901 [Dreissena polymorpha]
MHEEQCCPTFPVFGWRLHFRDSHNLCLWPCCSRSSSNKNRFSVFTDMQLE